MALPAIFIWSAITLVQAISAQCVRTAIEPLGITSILNNYNIECLGAYGPGVLAASHGAGLVVTSTSPMAPIGVTVVSENAYNGLIAVAGDIPFLGAVGVEGRLTGVGSGDVAYACGRGNVAILSENLARLLAEALACLAESLGHPLPDPFAYAGSCNCRCSMGY